MKCDNFCRITHIIITEWPQPLNEEKVRQLRTETQLKCPEQSLPLCDVTRTCLFNLKEDPCERYDYSEKQPNTYRTMKEVFESYRTKVVPPRNQPRDPCANPDFYNGFWTNWYDYSTLLENFAFRGELKKQLFWPYFMEGLFKNCCFVTKFFGRL